MPIPCSIPEREYSKFRECQGKTVVATKICQDDGEAIKVEIGQKGLSKNIYNGIASVPINVETLITTYTVPIGKKFDLAFAVCSGENRAKYSVKVNNQILQVKRTWWGDFNAEFNVSEDILLAGDKVELFVENCGDASVDFDGTIIGGEFDE